MLIDSLVSSVRKLCSAKERKETHLTSTYMRRACLESCSLQAESVCGFEGAAVAGDGTDAELQPGLLVPVRDLCDTQ